MHGAEGAGGQGEHDGDAHPGNLPPTRDGRRWNDLEDTCAGAVEWDLACLLRTGRLDGRDPDDARLAPLLELRDLHAELYGRMVAVYRA